MRFVAIALLACLAPAVSPAGMLADIEIFDATQGTTLPLYRHRGRVYVAGEPQHRYEIRVRNSSRQRLLAVTSVDGVNVVTGETAAQHQSGYVLGPYEAVNIDGWRKSLHDVATFYFTPIGDSYAARTGRPDDVGVIGVALFSERVPCCAQLNESRDQAKQDAPAAARESGGYSSRAEAQLGTGHGERQVSAAQYTEFERASSTPNETLIVYYDSMRNLIARGIVPKRYPPPKHGPRPFPNGFVPDP